MQAKEGGMGKVHTVRLRLNIGHAQPINAVSYFFSHKSKPVIISHIQKILIYSLLLNYWSFQTVSLSVAQEK